ncbi:HNH endonuclease [Streptomyces sp. NPDC048142]|uniref:HNH endonuclease n=1 Tax=Streptomyces sp. NPDC048142 TaxID=3365501 RepID=UPI00371624EB
MSARMRERMARDRTRRAAVRERGTQRDELGPTMSAVPVTTCAKHGMPATQQLLTMQLCQTCVADMTEEIGRWSARREAFAAEDTSGDYSCKILGCSNPTPLYREHAYGARNRLCIPCAVADMAERKRIDKARKEAERANEAARRAREVAAFAREREAILSRPCTRCEATNARSWSVAALCSRCEERRRRKRQRETRSRAAAARRARKARVPHEPYSRAETFARYAETCAYCDAPAEHIDHVNPISKGGADAPHNLLPACAPCNLSKGAKSLAEWAATF